MNQLLESTIFEMYNQWLLDKFADEIRCKDDLIEYTENKIHWEQFTMEVTKTMEEI